MIPTGIPLLDRALGGGLPDGVTEVFGKDGTGKTSLALSALREVSRTEPVMLVNAESRAGPCFIRSVVGDTCLMAVPRCGEAAIEAAYQALDAGIRAVAIDTLDACVPLLESRLEVGQREPLAHKRLVSHGLRILGSKARACGATVIVTSQVRSNPRRAGRKTQSSFERVTRDATDCRIQLFKQSSHSEYGVVKHTNIRFEIKRLLCSPPLGKVNALLWNGVGFRPEHCLFEALVADGRLERRGAFWFSADGLRVGPGVDNAIHNIGEDLTLYRDLLERI